MQELRRGARRIGRRQRVAPLAAVAALALGLLAAAAGCGGAASGPDGRDGPSPAPDAGEPIELPPALTVAAAAPDRWAKPLGFAVEARPLREDPAYRRTWVTQATSVTPENALKWNVVAPAEGRFDFRDADAIVDVARRTGKRVRGHPLVWDEQLPYWLTARGWDAAAMEALLRRHVGTIVRRYRGRVAVWDVVNEPLEGDGSLTPSVFTAALGERYLDVAFEAAHAADPDARLFLNEIYADRPGVKQSALIDLAGRLKDRGVPIDGVGLQGHLVVDDFPDRAGLGQAMDAVAARGLDVELTELDVPQRYPGELTPDTAQAQARAYGEAAAACATHAACTGLTFWGVTDRWSWLGEDRHPLPFDAAGRPKPAWRALQDAFARPD